MHVRRETSMKLPILLCALAFVSVLSQTECHKIFILFPMASRSHFNLGSSLAKGLAEAGNDVTFLSPFEDQHLPKNGTYRQLVVAEIEEVFKKMDTQNMFGDRSLIMFFKTFTTLLDELSVTVLNSTHIKTLLKNSETFDVVIIEEFLMDSLKILPHLFKGHLISFSPTGPSYWVNKYVANPSPLSYIPEASFGFPSKMTFFQRLTNVVMHYLFAETLSEVIMFPKQSRFVKETFPNAPDLDILRHNVSLVLLNSHVSTHPPVPLVPNMIPIGGYHVKPPKPLPTDLQEYLDSSKNGVIYFSMGSVLKSKDMPKEKIDILLTVFRQLKQNILWKWEDDNLPNKPTNVKIQKWLPQPSVLAHPNVKLFITHAGLLSTTEVIYHGKPVLAMPIFGDQPSNAQQMVNGEFGLRQDFKDLKDPKIFLDKIHELLNNPKYFENAQKRSRIMHDQPIKPMDSVNYWVDYVIRHNGASHLRVAGADLPWYIYYSVDVAAFLLSILLSVSGFLYYVVKGRFSTKKKFKTN